MLTPVPVISWRALATELPIRKRLAESSVLAWRGVTQVALGQDLDWLLLGCAEERSTINEQF